MTDEPETRRDAASRDCPACGPKSSTHWGTKAGFEILECDACRTLFVRIEPTAQQLHALYERYAYASGVGIPDVVRSQLARLVRRFQPFRQSGRLLDVGCGAGTLLAAANDQGWRASGLELSEAAIMLAKRSRLDVRQIEFLSYSENDFDVVVMIEVLEHVLDPVAFIKKAFECLRPGGLLYVTTPNALSLSRKFLGLDWSIISPPEHMQLFTACALREALERAGFRSPNVRSRGLNLWELRSQTNGTARHATRNEKAFALNDQLTRSPLRRAVKEILNIPLATTGTGDSLRAFAIRPLRGR